MEGMIIHYGSLCIVRIKESTRGLWFGFVLRPRLRFPGFGCAWAHVALLSGLCFDVDRRSFSQCFAGLVFCGDLSGFLLRWVALCLV